MKDTVDQSPTGGVAEQARASMESMLRWEDNITAALSHAEFSHTFDDVALMVLRGQLTFFDFGDCYCLAQINVFPQFKTFHFMVSGGDLDSIRSQTDWFKHLANEHGCRYLSFSGRKGFAPFLKKDGWEHKFTTMWLGVDQ